MQEEGAPDPAEEEEAPRSDPMEEDQLVEALAQSQAEEMELSPTETVGPAEGHPPAETAPMPTPEPYSGATEPVSPSVGHPDYSDNNPPLVKEKFRFLNCGKSYRKEGPTSGTCCGAVPVEVTEPPLPVKKELLGPEVPKPAARLDGPALPVVLRELIRGTEGLAISSKNAVAAPNDQWVPTHDWSAVTDPGSLPRQTTVRMVPAKKAGGTAHLGSADRR